MREHALFYYPYATLRRGEGALLQATALYFDRLYLLDPLQAIGDAGRGSGHAAASASGVELLEQEGLVERISPGEVLSNFGGALLAAIRTDLEDAGFSALCRREAKARTWTLSLGKVPRELRSGAGLSTDNAMQDLLRGPHRPVEIDTSDYTEYDETELGQIVEQHAEFAKARRRAESAASTEVHEKSYEGSSVAASESRIEYRFARYPVDVGEAIMLNHALLASLRLTGATPITDSAFHRKVMSYKLEQALEHPRARGLIDRDRIRAGLLALAVLTDTDLELPAMAPEIPLETVLEYRDRHPDELEALRLEFGALAAEINATALTREFTEEVRRVRLPLLRKRIAAAQRAQRSWLHRKRDALEELTGLGAGQLAAGIGLVFSGMPPLAIAAASAATAGSAALSAAPAVRRLKDKGGSLPELHYLVALRPSRRNRVAAAGIR